MLSNFLGEFLWVEELQARQIVERPGIWGCDGAWLVGFFLGVFGGAGGGGGGGEGEVEREGVIEEFHGRGIVAEDGWLVNLLRGIVQGHCYAREGVVQVV